MNIGQYNISFSKIEGVLEEFKLLKMKGIRSINETGVSDEFKSASIKDSYFSTYNSGLMNYDYDFLTIDQSFFQLEFKEREHGLETRFSFYQNPILYINYQDYVLQLIADYGLDSSVEEIGELFIQDYDQFLNEQEAIANFTTIRYDLDPKNYKAIVHSVSHLHVGHQNNIRIPLNKVISPLEFVLFVIKHVYFNDWKDKVEKDLPFILSCLESARSHDTELSQNEWTTIESLELHII